MSFGDVIPMILVTNNEGTPGAPVTAQCLHEGQSALDAIEAGIRLVESDESIRTVGRGGWANLLGEVELDAAVMDGTSLRTGAVGAIKNFLHPVSIARQVLERLPHEFLVGAGAERFATEIGAERGELLTPRAADAWKKWFDNEVSKEDRARWPDVALADYCRQAIDPEVGRDTTVFLAIDRAGNVASGTSTSGWGWKYPGRLGDSPVIGAGSYADSRYGACACTGAGEMTLRLSTARSVVLYMKLGKSVEEAVMEAAEDMRALKGGLIGRVTIHAIDRQGDHKVLAVNGDGSQSYWLWEGGPEAPVRQPAPPFAISEGPIESSASARYAQS
jgi:L-asparaginase / beta-aspartyl-peptidase